MKKLFAHYRRLFSDHKQWLLIAMGWFLLGGGIGVAVYALWPELVMSFLKMLKEKFLQDKTEGFSEATTIFLHNFLSSAICLLLGVLVGLAPVFALVANGFAMGCVSAVMLFGAKHSFSLSLLVLAAAIVPHGIIELPTIILCAAIGLKIGWAWLGSRAEGKRIAVLKDNYIAGLKALPGIALLLALAALIETFVTPHVILLVVGPTPLDLVH